MLPIIAVHTSYLLAAFWQHVPWCVPYWDSCTSISAAARQSPEYYFFKATMIPAAIMMMLFWRVSYEWLLALGDDRNWQTRTIPLLGFIAALCLILYTTVGRRWRPVQIAAQDWCNHLLLLYHSGTAAANETIRPNQCQQ